MEPTATAHGVAAPQRASENLSWGGVRFSPFHGRALADAPAATPAPGKGSWRD